MHSLPHAARCTPCRTAVAGRRLTCHIHESRQLRQASSSSGSTRPQASGNPVAGAPKPNVPKSRHPIRRVQSDQRFRVPEALPRYTPSSGPKPPAGEAAAKLCERVRGAMRFVAHPVAIVSTVADRPDGWGSGLAAESGPLRGLVVSSFNVVSLDAEAGPIVSFNLRIPSSTFDAIKTTGTFDISLPWSSQVCDTFAVPASRDQMKPGKARQMIEEQSVFTFQCKWLQQKSVQVADHMLMVGKIEGYLHGGGVVQGTIARSKIPLNYASGVLIRMEPGTAVGEKARKTLQEKEKKDINKINTKSLVEDLVSDL